MGNNLIYMRRRLGIMSQPHRETQTGDLVTFTGIKAPLSVLAQIVPVQAGSGDPSPENVRNITGWTGCDVVRTGKNLFDPASTKNEWVYVGDTTVLTRTNAKSNRIPCSVGDTITASSSNNTASTNIILIATLDKNGSVLSRNTEANGTKYLTVTAPSNAVEFLVSYGTYQNAGDMQVEKGSSALSYSAYSGTTISVDWTDTAGTVYGGSLQINPNGTGVLTVTDEYYEFDGSEDEVWRKASSGIYFFIKVSETKVYENDAIISNMYPQGKAASNTDVINITYASSGTSKDSIYIHPSWVDEDTTIADIKAYLAEHTLQAVVKLIIPVTYNLTEEQVGKLLALNGVNNIWANTGEISVEYWKN